MNAPENCGRAPPQVCAGDAFGPQAKPSPAGDGFSGLRPLAPAAPGRPAARPSPCRNPAFIFNTNRIIQSNLYSFSTDLPPSAIRRASISCQKSASIGPSPCKGLAWETAARPLLHRLCARPRNRGAAPSERPGLRPALFSAFIQLVLYRKIILTFDRIPPRFCDHKCHVPFPRCQNSAEQSSERKSKITSSTMVYAWKKRGHPTVGRAYPLGSSKAGLYDTSRDTNLPSLPHFPLRPFRRPQTPYQDKMPFPVILRRPSPHPPPAALCRPASVIPRHGGAAGPPPAPH